MRTADRLLGVMGALGVVASAALGQCPEPRAVCTISGTIGVDTWGGGWTGAAIESGTPRTEGFSVPYQHGVNPPTIGNTEHYGRIAWGPSSNGGSAQIDVRTQALNTCCTFNSTHANVSIGVWVAGDPGTRYKLRVRVTSSGSTDYWVVNSTGYGGCPPESLWSTASPGGPGESEIDIPPGRTTSQTTIVDGQVYSFATSLPLLTASTGIIQNWYCGIPCCQPSFFSHAESRATITVEAVRPDPMTFALTMGVDWPAGPLGAEWQPRHRGDLGADAVNAALSRFGVQRSSLNFTASNTSTAPAITSSLQQIQELAAPGDTLIVYWESHASVDPLGDYPFPIEIQGCGGGLDGQIRRGPARLYAGSTTEAQLTQSQFADLFSGGKLDCMNKLFVMANCFADRFGDDLLLLPRTAVAAGSAANRCCNGQEVHGENRAALGYLLAQALNEVPAGVRRVSPW